MKKPITYRKITVALGILVAILIALTFWPSVPVKRSSHPKPVWQINLPTVETAQSRLIQKVFTLFPFLEAEDRW